MEPFVANSCLPSQILSCQYTQECQSTQFPSGKFLQSMPIYSISTSRLFFNHANCEWFLPSMSVNPIAQWRVLPSVYRRHQDRRWDTSSEHQHRLPLPQHTTPPQFLFSIAVIRFTHCAETVNNLSQTMKGLFAMGHTVQLRKIDKPDLNQD